MNISIWAEVKISILIWAIITMLTTTLVAKEDIILWSGTTKQGVLHIPRVTTKQRDIIDLPTTYYEAEQEGVIIFNVTTGRYETVARCDKCWKRYIPFYSHPHWYWKPIKEK